MLIRRNLGSRTPGRPRATFIAAVVLHSRMGVQSPFQEDTKSPYRKMGRKERVPMLHQTFGLLNASELKEVIRLIRRRS